MFLQKAHLNLHGPSVRKMEQDLKAFLDPLVESLGLSHYGLSDLGRPLSFDFYQEWLQQNYQGEMGYLREHAPVKENSQNRWPQMRSALVFAIPYFPHPEPVANFPLRQARLSLYARGRDYHFWFREKMQILIEGLKGRFPQEEFLALTDSAPIMERDLGRRASLGWVGKNTCLIHPKKGSLFFIGEILTSLQLKNDLAELPDFCGTCRRCIEICPTQALLEPRKLDARRCISYLTIESRSIPDENLRAQMGDWLFGCDLCQTVCPWNQKIFRSQLSTEAVLSLAADQEDDLTRELRYLLTTSGKQLERDLKESPLARAGSFGLRRNAMVVAANRKIKNLHGEISAYVDHPKLGELARWALNALES